MNDIKFKRALQERDQRIVNEVLETIARLAEETPEGEAIWTLREAAAEFQKRIMRELGK